MIVPDAIRDEIREHAESMRPGRECVGRIVCRGGVAIRYDRLRNWAQGNGRFTVHKEWATGLKGAEAVMCHSHPNGGGPHPSYADVEKASKHWLGVPYAIYHMDTDSLGIFALWPDRDGWSEWGEWIAEASRAA